MFQSEFHGSENDAPNSSVITCAASDEAPTSDYVPVFGELMRSLSEAADSQQGMPCSASDVWQALLAGDLTVVDTFYSAERWFMALGPVAGSSGLTPRTRTLLERVLIGDGQKRAAIECGLSGSTLSVTVHRALSAMGLRLAPCKVPPLLVALARASRRRSFSSARLSRVRYGTREFHIVSVARPELSVARRLPRAEYEVLSRIIEGRTYAEIALERRRSVRTVANQASGAFRRLGVSGRAELVSRLVETLATA